MPSDVVPNRKSENERASNASPKPDFLLKLLPEIPSDGVFPKSHMAPAFLILKVTCQSKVYSLDVGLCLFVVLICQFFPFPHTEVSLKTLAPCP